MTVANRIESFDITVPAGTPKAAPVTTDVSFPDGKLQRVEIDVPDGHAGLTGIQLLGAKGQVIPYTTGAFLVANDHAFGWDLVGQLDSGSFQVRCFNTDIYPHGFSIRFSVLDFGYATSDATAAAEPPPPVLV